MSERDDCIDPPHAGAAADMLTTMRREAAMHSALEMAHSLQWLSLRGAIRLDVTPLPRHASRARKRLRRQQVEFEAWWHDRCSSSAALHIEASAMYAAACAGEGGAK